jgi:hypothetical protein
MARVDYDRMAADYVEGRVLPPEGMEPWRAVIAPWVSPHGAGRGRMGAITLYQRYFPGAGRALVATGGLPAVEEVSAAFAGVGFATETLTPVDQVSATSLAAYRDKVRLRADTGLRLLPDEQFAEGLAALDRAVEAETIPAPVVDRLDLLVLRRSGS